MPQTREEAINLLKSTPEGMIGRGVYELGKAVMEPAERYYQKAKQKLAPELVVRSKAKPKVSVKRKRATRKY